MSKKIKKVCKHKPGDEWADGCCSSNLPVDISSREPDGRAIESTKQPLIAETEALST